MLDQLTLPVEFKEFDAEKSDVSVALTVTDPGHWVPSNPKDRTWDEKFQKMVQV